MNETKKSKNKKVKQVKPGTPANSGTKSSAGHSQTATANNKKKSGIKTADNKLAGQFEVPNRKPAQKMQSDSAKTTNRTSAANVKKPVKKTNKKSIALVSFILLFIAAASVITAVKLGVLSFAGTSADIKGFFSGFVNGGGYPYSLSDSTIISTEKIGSGIMVLDSDSLSIMNSTAHEIVSVQHTFSNPATDISNGRAVLFDRASGRFKVISRAGVIFEKDMEKSILTASLGNRGNLAVATKSLSLQSELTVFDKNKKQIFVWECAAERISAVALSGNGKTAAVTVIGAENAELYSKVIVFDFSKEEPVAVFDYPDTALIKLKFGSSNTIIAAGDNLTSVITLKTLQKQDFSYESGQLNRLFIHEKGRTAVVLSAFGNQSQNNLRVYSAKGLLLFEKSFTQEVRWVSCDENYISVLLADEVQSFNDKGQQMGSIKADKYTERIIAAGKKTYLMEKGSIAQYPTVGMNN